MKITSKMLAEFKTNIRAWRDKDKKEMKALYTKDRKDLTSIYNDTKKGKLQLAGDKAYWLDTVVRDQIPKKIYNIIIKESYDKDC